MLPSEPNSKMDELLRAYAKKRREQAEPPLSMHPATRKLLQEEVKRTLRAAPPQPRQNWRSLRWPLLALGGGFAALMVMLAVVNMQMRSLMPANSPANRSLSEAKPMLKAPAPSIAPEPQTSIPLAAAAPPTFKADQIAPATVLPAAPSDRLDVAAGEFVQIHDRVQEKKAQSPVSSVLAQFQIQRSGQNVRIVDDDGSVYVGQVLSGVPGLAGSGRQAGGARYARTQTREATNEAANWSFKVTGTNNHLQQNIVFTGNVQAMPASAPAGNAAALNRSAPRVQNAPATAPIPTVQNARIKGKLQVGNGKEFEMEAKSTTP
jgi:hypothetical protein